MRSPLLTSNDLESLALRPSGEMRAQAKNPVDLYIASLESELSRRTMVQALARVSDIIAGRPPAKSAEENMRRAREFHWGSLRAQHVQILKARIGEEITNRTTGNKLLAAIRGVMKFARMERLITAEDYQDIVMIKLFKAEKQPRGRALNEDELTALAIHCRADQTISGRRDAALMAIAYGAGLRRLEISNLNISDWDPTENRLKVRHGKGNKERYTYLSESGARVLNKWLALRVISAGTPNAPMFISIKKGGIPTGRRLSDDAIYDIFRRRARRAGIKTFTPHDMRRSCISDLLDSGADLSAVAQLAGHADTNTTRKYDRRGERAKREAASKLKVPF